MRTYGSSSSSSSSVCIEWDEGGVEEEEEAWNIMRRAIVEQNARRKKRRRLGDSTKRAKVSRAEGVPRMKCRDAGVIVQSMCGGNWLENIFGYLCGEELAMVSKVCVDWSRVAAEERIWKSSFKGKYIAREDHRANGHSMTWREMTKVRFNAEKVACVPTRKFGGRKWLFKYICPACCCFKVLQDMKSLKRHWKRVHSKHIPSRRKGRIRIPFATDFPDNTPGGRCVF